MHSIQYGNKRIDYEIKRGNREKTVAIHVNPTAAVTVLAPRRLNEERIRAIVQKKARWILEKQEFLKRNEHLTSPKEFVSGESFPYLGRQYRLKVLRTGGGPGGTCKLIQGRFQVEIEGDLGAEEEKRSVRKALTAWYLRHAGEKVKERIDQLAKQLGKYPQRIEIKEQKRRWGSCSRSGVIRLNWKIIMTPISILDYVIVHELCHLIHPHHSPQFWNKVQSILPDHKKRRDLLRQHSLQIDALPGSRESR